ncbi:MAG: hypothetical protein H7175_17000 [Burkholderiales bacterium]|nr:hypothetical protein [Anaerolineae bacterium]
MKLRYTVLSIGLLAALSLLLVPSVFADHEWFVTDVECDADGTTITIFGDSSLDTSVTTDVYADGEFIGEFSGPGFIPGPISYEVSDPAFEGAEIFVENPETGTSASTTCGDDLADNGQFFEPGDDRINRQAYAPIAIYCAETRLEIYAIDANGVGTIATYIDFTALPATPTDENLLFETVGNIQLYHLTSGEYVATSGPDAEGKFYMLLWDGCPANYIQAYIQQNGIVTPTENFPR